MATARLVASTYSVSGTVTVSNPSNMYTNVDSTNYATATHTTSGTSSYYLYIKGFNYTAVPSDANVTSIKVYIKGYESQNSTSSSYAPRLVNNTTAISNTTASENFSSSTNTIEIPIGDITWSDIVNTYKSDLGIRVTVRRSSKNKQSYVYIYGAEIEVTYTEPGSNALYVKQNGAWTEVTAAYKKINGSWVEQSDLTTVFSSGTNYIKGN